MSEPLPDTLYISIGRTDDGKYHAAVAETEAANRKQTTHEWGPISYTYFIVAKQLRIDVVLSLLAEENNQ